MGCRLILVSDGFSAAPLAFESLSPSVRHTILRPTASKPIPYNVAMASKKDKAPSSPQGPPKVPALRPEDVVYRICYARANLSELLQSAETRSRIRRLPPAQLFFSLKELDEAEIQRLLPHLTEEQWTGILDLDLWSRDRVLLNRFLYRMSHILRSEDAVTQKLLRGTDLELLGLALNPLRIHRLDEDGAPEAEGPVLETPDHHYVVELPEDAEEARFLRAFILRLYELDSEGAALLLEESHFRTWSEMEEMAYQSRKRRVEDMGFQDYYDAIEIYALLPLDASLPLKNWEKIREVSALPLAATELSSGSILLIAALARFTRPQEMESLLEELFFVCNKLLVADRISPDDPALVKQGISKEINGINLGLDCWSGGNLLVAEEGLAKHYLQSFFRLGYSQIRALQEEARRIQSETPEPEPGSFLEAVLHGILERYPVFTESKEGQIGRRFFSTREDLAMSHKHLSEIENLEPTRLAAGKSVSE